MDRTAIPSPEAGARGEMKDRARRQFDDWAGTYDRSLLNPLLFRPSYRVFMEEIARWHRQRPGRFVALDVGCATGTLALMLARSPWPVSVVGLDYSPAMCAEGAAKTARATLSDPVRFVAADSEHLPFADGSFDILTCSNSFHHYPHPRAVVREMRRVLRPGGRLILIDGFRDNVIGWFVFDVCIAAVEKTVHHAPWSQIDAHFVETGFRNIRRRKFNFWLPLLATIGDA